MNTIEEIKNVYLELGRDPKKLKLTKYSEEELKEVLHKLKVVKHSLELLFSPDPGVELAKELLTVTFKNKNEKSRGERNGH